MESNLERSLDWERAFRIGMWVRGSFVEVLVLVLVLRALPLSLVPLRGWGWGRGCSSNGSLES